jgi:hypothetical protein
MSKRIFIVVLLSVFFLLYRVVSAQEVGFGLKAGLNLSTLKVDDPELSYDSRTGYHAGIFLRGKFDKVAIQPEVLLFTQRNAGSTLAGTFQEDFTYLSIPVLFKFYILSGLNIHAGPQFGFLLDGERTSRFPLVTTRSDITEHYKKTDVAASLGAGFDFPFGLNVDVRYNLGIKDINNQVNGEDTRSRIFLVSLGWNFIR